MRWSIKLKKIEWNCKSTLNDNVFTDIDLCINDGITTIIFLYSTTKTLYQCLVSCMYILGEVTPIIFNSLFIKSYSAKEVFLHHSTTFGIPNYKNFNSNYYTIYWLRIIGWSDLNSQRLMPVHFVELKDNLFYHDYIYFGAAVTQLIFGVEKWWLAKTGENMSIEEDYIFAGNTNSTGLQNHILILAKYCMYASWCNNCMPSVQLFVAKVYSTRSVEENVSRENNTINKFIDKLIDKNNSLIKVSGVTQEQHI